MKNGRTHPIEPLHQHAWMVLAAALVVCLGTPAFAWEWKDLRLRGRLQTRWEVQQQADNWTNAFALRRARVDGRFEPVDWLRLMLEVEGTDGVELKDAYARIDLFNPLRITAGQFKKPYSRLRMSSPFDIDLPERGLLDRHVVRKTSHGGYGGRDLGLMLSGKFLKPLKFRYYLGVFNGDGRLDGRDESHRDWVGRLQLRLVKGLVLAVNLSHKLYHLGEATRTVNLFGGDLRWTLGDFRLQLEGSYGDFVDAGQGHKLFGGHLIARYRIELFESLVLSPALMVELLDPDDQVEDGRALRLAGALNLDFGEMIRLVVYAEGSLGEARTYDPDRDRVAVLPSSTIVGVQLSLRI